MEAKLKLNPDGKSGVLIFDEEFYHAVEANYLRMQKGFRTAHGRDGSLEELTESMSPLSNRTARSCATTCNELADRMEL
jgi:hypothetical protein